jgi:hypothetical protein
MIPRIIQPVTVRVEQVNGPATTVDPVFGEPVGPVARTPIDLPGQVRELRGDALTMTSGGASPLSNAVGRIVFDRLTLEARGVTLHKGDRITAIAGRVVDFRVLRMENHGYYRGAPYLVHAYYGPEGG